MDSHSSSPRIAEQAASIPNVTASEDTKSNVAASVELEELYLRNTIFGPCGISAKNTSNTMAGAGQFTFDSNIGSSNKNNNTSNSNNNNNNNTIINNSDNHTNPAASASMFLMDFLDFDSKHDWNAHGSLPNFEARDNTFVNMAENIPEESSPAMSLCTPALVASHSPLGFDEFSFDDFTPSPSTAFESPFEEALGASQSPLEEFDYGFDVGHHDFGHDFQLFPTEIKALVTVEATHTLEATTTLEQLLMHPAPGQPNSSFVFDVKQSPHDPRLEDFMPPPTTSASPSVAESFTKAKILGQDVQVPDRRVAVRKVTQSPTKPGFQPTRRTRRRRITTEEASRVVPEDDPNGRARYQCKVCNKTFSRPFNLRSHRAIHEGFKPYACHESTAKGPCTWSFARRHDLERHIKSRHLAVKFYECSTCGVKCTRSDAFKRHLSNSVNCGTNQDAYQVSHM
ncbi:hypothetical protein BG004_007339 [Podila humilis]|nr:hypothetical protein BG004_007339 [Podila humilis]